jgi:hypothetical protein
MDTIRKPAKPRLGAPKKSYRTPVLSRYGDVRRLTRGGNGTGNEGGVGPKSMTCWIAEALYGVDAPRTQLVRRWLTQSHERGVLWARIVVPLYARHGRAVAQGVRRSPIVAGLFRPVFDAAVRRASRDFALQTLARRA